MRPGPAGGAARHRVRHGISWDARRPWSGGPPALPGRPGWGSPAGGFGLRRRPVRGEHVLARAEKTAGVCFTGRGARRSRCGLGQRDRHREPWTRTLRARPTKGHAGVALLPGLLALYVPEPDRPAHSSSAAWWRGTSSLPVSDGASRHGAWTITARARGTRSRWPSLSQAASRRPR